MPSVTPIVYIRQAISSGRSANSAYRAMRRDIANLTTETGQTWHGIGRQTFLRLYSETLAARNKVGNALDYDITQLPDGTVMTDRQSRYSRGYLTWLTIYSREQGTSDIETQFFAVHSRQPLTPEQAMLKAQEGFETSAAQAHGTLQGQVFVGSTYSGTWRMVPRTAG